MVRRRMIRVGVASGLIAIGALAGLAFGQAGRQAPPCGAPEYRQFDFWIGTWDVATPEGKPVGTNLVRQILDGCVIEENWSGTTGGDGKSFNIYLARDRRWHQTWVASNGNFLMLEGGVTDGKMVMSGSSPAPDGTQILNVISWEPLPEGRVRQHWRSSGDGGKTWSDVFIGIYTKRK